jgi:hypothetical protein
MGLGAELETGAESSPFMVWRCVEDAIFAFLHNRFAILNTNGLDALPIIQSALGIATRSPHQGEPELILNVRPAKGD